MKLLRNAILFLVALAMLAFGAMFAVENEAAVPLNLLFVILPERPVALWVLLAFAAGGLVGVLISWLASWRQARLLKRSNRKLARLDAARSAESKDAPGS